MKPEKYDGTTCFETFLTQFSNCADFNEWTDREKLSYLKWCLKGSAAQMLWGAQEMTYKRLVAKLRSRFGSADLEERYQADLQCRRRKHNESLRELAQDIRRLMMLSYPGDQSPIAENLAKEHFIVALEDPELELKIREREPRTLDSALKVAQRLEVFKTAVRQPRPCDVWQVTENQEEPFIETVAKVGRDVPKATALESLEVYRETSGEDVQDSWKDDLLKRVKELEQAQQAAEANLRRITAEKETLNKEVERLRQIERLWAPPSRLTFTPRDRLPQQPYPIICFKCREPGHKARECLQQSNAGVQINRNGDTDDLSRTVSMDRGRYLRVTLGHRVVDCLLDSGSEVCLLPHDDVPPNYIRETKTTLITVNGVSIPILGEASLPLSIGQFSTTITALVSGHVTEPMLGIDFLVDNRVVCDFAKSSITVAGVTHSLLSKSGSCHRCRKVTLQGSVQVPVKSRVILPTNVRLKSCPDRPGNKCRSVGLGQIGQELHVSRILQPHNAGTRTPMKILNTREMNVSQKTNLSHSGWQQIELLQEMGSQSKMSSTVRQVKNRLISGFTRKSAKDASGPVLTTAYQALEACLSPCLNLSRANGNDFSRGQLRPDTRRGGTIDQRDARNGKRGRHFVRRCPPRQF